MAFCLFLSIHVQPISTTLLSQLNTYQTLVIAIMAFFAPQLVINVRKEEHAKNSILNTSQFERELGFEFESNANSRTAVEVDGDAELTWELGGVPSEEGVSEMTLESGTAPTTTEAEVGTRTERETVLGSETERMGAVSIFVLQKR